MNDSSPKRNRASPGPNPRRKPAAESVSLVHPRKARSIVSEQPPSPEDDSSISSMQVDAASGLPSKSQYQKDSSGESSNPEKWFQKSNNNVKTGTASFADDEPPFFLRNSSSEATPPEIFLQRTRDAQAPPTLQANPDSIPESGSEEYRSVIDDLTIENKQLKRNLRKYERLQTAQLTNGALFEVRFHGLPAEKKRELEELLRTFVTKVDRSPHPSSKSASARESTALESGAIRSSAMASNLSSSLLAGPSASLHSHLGPGDSGYASQSGQQSSAHSGQGMMNASGDIMKSDRTKDIQNYLSEIPAGLIPTRSGLTTEKTKRKSVVRKLEQLFAGRESSGAHQQPKQQERLAQSAARQDRRHTEASGAEWQTSGTREARIMSKGPDFVPKVEPSPTSDSRSMSDDQDTSMADDDDDDVVEQRPTRPLDLDPHRAQIPAENMQYIRHLGFSPPDEEEMRAQPDGHGWIHLNVLANMAQLHFMNVTHGFVRKAIADYSKKLELSPDGRKVRWKGGKDVTISSSSTSPDQELGSTSMVQPNHISKPGGESYFDLSKDLAAGRHPRHRLSYSPIFRTREDSEAETGIDNEMNYQLSNLTPASGLNSSGQPKTFGKRPVPAGDDPATLIFYQNVSFYTDLNGDPVRQDSKHKSNYKRMTTSPVGAADSEAKLEKLRMMEYEKGPFSQLRSSNLSSSGRDDSSSSPVETDLKVIFPTRKGDIQSSGSSVPDLIDLEASGIGGVEPADNFAINVRSRQRKGDTMETLSSSAKQRSKPYPLQIRNALLSRSRNNSAAGKGTTTTTASIPSTRKLGNTKSIVQREIIRSKRTDMPASVLPAAVYFHYSSDEDEDDDINSDEDQDTSDTDEVPKSALQQMDWPAGVVSKPSSGSEFEDENDEDDEDDDDDDDNDDFSNGNRPPRHTKISPITLPKLSPSLHHHHHQTNSSSLPPSGSAPTYHPHTPRNHSLSSSTSSKSIDRLATAANAIDPNMIRQHDREFDSVDLDAHRLADDIPTGSSAATADGGSGFTSPAYADSTTATAAAGYFPSPRLNAAATAAAIARGEMPPPLVLQMLTQRQRSHSGGGVGQQHQQLHQHQHQQQGTSASGSVARPGLKRARKSDETSSSRARRSPKIRRSDSESS